MDPKLLEELHLNGSEVAVYQAVVRSGSINPTALAKASGIKRTTAYSVARSLVEKGLLIEDSTRRPRVFSAATPEQVLDLINEEKERVTAREATLQKVAAELSKISAKASYPVPTVRFVEEDKIGSFLRQQSPEWDKSLMENDGTWWGFLDHTFLDSHADWLDWYWNRKDLNERVNVKLLSNRTPVEIEVKSRLEKKAGERRQTKYWGEVVNFLSSSWIVGDYVIMVNTRTHPFYVVEVHDKLMAHDQREIYRNIWDLI